MGTPAITPTITSMFFFINCTPGGPKPDPIWGTFHVEYDNTLGTASGSAKVVSSELEIANFNEPTDVWDFSVDPAKSGNVPAGASLDVLHSMVHQSGSGVPNPCSRCDDHWTLKLQWDIEGQIVDKATKSDDVSCEF